MEPDLLNLLSTVGSASSSLTFPGVLAFGFILWRMGVFDKKNGNGNGYQKQIDKLKHDVTDIKTDVAWIRGKLDT